MVQSEGPKSSCFANVADQHFISHIHTYSLQSMHVFVLKVFVVFVFKLNSIGTCQFRYPPNGQLSTIYAKAVLSGWLF